MSVKATRHHKDTTRKEAALWDRNVITANDLEETDCPEICIVCRVYDVAEALASEGWKVEVEPFEDLPVLHVRGSKKTRSIH